MYTTKKKSKYYSNQMLGAFLIFLIFVFKIDFSSLVNYPSFSYLLGNIENILFTIVGLGVAIYSYRKTQALKGFKFYVTENEFVYKSFDEEVTFNSDNPPINILLIENEINIIRNDKKTISINLEDYSLNKFEKRKIRDNIRVLNRIFTDE